MGLYEFLLRAHFSWALHSGLYAVGNWATTVRSAIFYLSDEASHLI
jgi:hypothetical protein